MTLTDEERDEISEVVNGDRDIADTEWQRFDPPGLRLKYILSWMVGRRKRGMVANPRGFREDARPPYHTTPVPSPHLVPRLFRPLWALFYYLPLWAKSRASREGKK